MSSSLSPDTASPNDTKNIFLFIELPGELRIKIYEYSLNWNDVKSSIEKAQHLLEAADERHLFMSTQEVRQELIQEIEKLKGKKRTPNVLLLCRKITEEALDTLHGTPLVLNRTLSAQLIRDWDLWFRVEDLISTHTLRTIRQIHFELPTVKVLHAANLKERADLLVDLYEDCRRTKKSTRDPIVGETKLEKVCFRLEDGTIRQYEFNDREAKKQFAERFWSSNFLVDIIMDSEKAHLKSI